jgi:hypothetical protein
VIGSTTVKCNQYSVINNWSQGENKFIIYVPINITDYEVSSEGSNWTALNSWTSGISCTSSCSILTWEQRLSINTELRLDQSNNLIINSSPSRINFLIHRYILFCKFN